MERKYYVVEEFQRKGPYNIEELKTYGITKESIIWAFEFSDPKKASEIPELAEIFTEIKVEKKLDSNKNTKLSDDELLKKYEEIMKQDVEKKKLAMLENEKEEEVAPTIIIEQPEKKQEEKIASDEKDITNIIIDQSGVKEPEEISFEQNNNNEFNFGGNVEGKTDKSEEQIKEELFSNFIDEKEFENTTIEYQTTKFNFTDGSQNVEYESTIGPKDLGTKPQNYIVWSILTLIFCCNVFGIISLITGNQVDKKYAMGDLEGAKKASSTTLTILIISVIVSLIGIIIVASSS